MKIFFVLSAVLVFILLHVGLYQHIGKFMSVLAEIQEEEDMQGGAA